MANTIAEFRLEQIRRLWDKRFGVDRVAKTFDNYERGIPPIPRVLYATTDTDLPFISLADPRPLFPRVCKRAGVLFGPSELEYLRERALVPFYNQDSDPNEPFWFRHDDGRKNRNHRVVECRERCTGDVRVATAVVGVFAYLHHPQILTHEGHAVYLPGSVSPKDRFYCALLSLNDGEVSLHVGGTGSAKPNIGILRYRLK